MSFKRPNPVACRPVSEHRLLVEACTEEKDSINRLRRELQLDDGAAMAGTHDGNLPHKINAGLWTGGCLDHVRVLCVHARATAASKGELTMGSSRVKVSILGLLFGCFTTLTFGENPVTHGQLPQAPHCRRPDQRDE